MPPSAVVEAVKIIRLCNVRGATAAVGTVFTVGKNKDLEPTEATEMIAIGRAVSCDPKGKPSKD